MSIDIPQAFIVDKQEQVAETHVLLRLERDEKDEERRFNIQSRIGQNLRDFYAALPYEDFTTLLRKFRLSLDKAQEYMRGEMQRMNRTSTQEDTTVITSKSEVEIIHPQLLRPHPSNEQIYGQESIEDLQERIRVSQWIKPLVVTPQNIIISGHRRWRVAIALEMHVPIERRTFASEVDELEALLLENVTREKIPEQKGREGTTWEYIYAERAKEKQEAQGEHGKEGGRGKKKEETLGATWPQGFPEVKKKRAPRTRDKVAAEVGLGSGKTYERVKKVIHTIDTLHAKGHIQEAQALRQVLNTQGEDGNINVAAKVAELPEEKQLALLEPLATGEAKNVKDAQKQVKREELAGQVQSVVLPQELEIWHGDFRTLGHRILNATVDLIFTDPPYHKEHLPLWSSLGEFAARTLKPGGILLAYSGQIFLPDVLNLLSEHLTYCWLLGVAHTGGHIQIWKHQVWNDWKPLVMFSNGPPLEHEWLMDLYRGDKGDKDSHEWSQGEGEAAYYIEKLTKPGQLVVDPLCGSGTILRAAYALHRHSIGIEVDEERYHTAKGGMKEVVNV